MKRLKFALYIIPVAILQWGCSNDSTSDLIGDPVDVVTYTNTVKAAIDSQCLSCHTQPPQNGAPMPLVTYDNVKNAVLTHGLLDRISRPQGSPGMMPNGGTRLPQPTIDKISEWIDNGMPE